MEINIIVPYFKTVGIKHPQFQIVKMNHNANISTHCQQFNGEIITRHGVLPRAEFLPPAIIELALHNRPFIIGGKSNKITPN